MTNSFYYFFSATPQVLAAILALFGVFVIFKIQSIKSELLSIGKVIYNYVLTLAGTSPFLPGIDDARKQTLKGYRDLINQWILSKDVRKLKEQIDLTKDKEIWEDFAFQNFKEKYDKEYSILLTLIDDTIKSSIITAVVIVICLVIIPFGAIIICHPFILYTLFGLIVICVSFVFYRLVTTLKKSIEETAITT